MHYINHEPSFYPEGRRFLHADGAQGTGEEQVPANTSDALENGQPSRQQTIAMCATQYWMLGIPSQTEPVACGWDRAHRWGGARGCWPPLDASIEDAISTACTPAARAHRMNSERMPDRVGPGVGVPPKIRPQHALACWPSPAQALKDLSRMETLRPRIEPDARHVEILWPRSWGALGPVNGRDRPREWGRPCGNRGMAVCVVLKRPGWVLTVSEHLERAPYCSIKAVCLPFQITI